MDRNVMKLALTAVALAMGVAVIVTNIVAPLGLSAVTNLLAIAVAALAIAALQK